MACWLSGKPVKAKADNQHAIFYVFLYRREARMKRMQVLIIASGILLQLVFVIVALLVMQQGNFVHFQQYAFSTKDGSLRFFVLSGQTSTLQYFVSSGQSTTQRVATLPAYRTVFSLPLWTVISAGLVLPIICIYYLIVGTRSATPGFEVLEAANRPTG